MTETVDSIVATIPMTHEILPKAASVYMIEQARRYGLAAGADLSVDFVRGLYTTMTAAAHAEQSFGRTQEAHRRFMESAKLLKPQGSAT